MSRFRIPPFSRFFSTGIAFGVALGGLAITGSAADTAEGSWPAWRGSDASGAAHIANPPIRWSETENVKWKVKLPGSGTSTPVIWKDTIFLLTAVPVEKAAGSGARSAPEPSESEPGAIENSFERVQAPGPGDGPRPRPRPDGPPRGEGRPGRPGGPGGPGGPPGGGFGGGETPSQTYKFVLLAVDKASGKVRWERTAREEVPHEGHHRDHGYASASPVTDGEHLIVFFGSRGLYSYDMEGNLLWKKDLGKMRTRNGFGEGNSPALHGNTVVIAWDHEGEDFIAAFDKRDGRELWRKDRDEPTNWTTPIVVEHDGRAQVVVNGTNMVRSYDLETGELLWEAGGQTTNAIPSPVHGHGRIYVTSGFRGSAFHAIQLGRRGNLTDTDAIVWKLDRGTPYVPSPLLYDDLLYFMAGNNAMISIVDAISGKVHVNSERLSGINGVYASPMGASGRVYILGRDGGAVVLKHGKELEVLATNRLEDGFDASPVAVGNELFLRGREYFYCIAQR